MGTQKKRVNEDVLDFQALNSPTECGKDSRDGSEWHDILISRHPFDEP